MIDLSPGFTWLLVDDDLGLADGYYTVQTRCIDGTNTCDAGGITGVGYKPPRGGFGTESLNKLLSNPTVSLPSSYRLTVTVGSAPWNMPSYNRSTWQHWTDDDGDCQDTRQEVLIAESVEPITYSDANDCRVGTGSWVGAYTWETVSDPGDLDIDHLVPLANAHRSGAWAWDAGKKRDYANDLSRDSHLVAVKASANRAKGANGPGGVETACAHHVVRLRQGLDSGQERLGIDRYKGRKLGII